MVSEDPTVARLMTEPSVIGPIGCAVDTLKRVSENPHADTGEETGPGGDTVDGTWLDSMDGTLEC